MPATVYPVEAVWIETTEHSITIKGTHPSISKEPAVILTMPLVVGKEVAILLRNLLSQWEAKHEVISLPQDFINKTRIAPNDWPLPPRSEE